MFDSRIRHIIGPSLDKLGGYLAARGVKPWALSATGWIVGVGACIAASQRAWVVALTCWLFNRAFDGLDGPVARALGPTKRGGFIDIVADFSIYAGFIVGIAISTPAARLACVVLLFAYYVSGTAFLAISSLLERQEPPKSDERSLRFVGGIAEGAETVVVYVLFCVFTKWTTEIAWVFSVAVGITAIQRIVIGLHLLKGERSQ